MDPTHYVYPTDIAGFPWMPGSTAFEAAEAELAEYMVQHWEHTIEEQVGARWSHGPTLPVQQPSDCDLHGFDLQVLGIKLCKEKRRECEGREKVSMDKRIRAAYRRVPSCGRMRMHNPSVFIAVGSTFSSALRLASSPPPDAAGCASSWRLGRSGLDFVTLPCRWPCQVPQRRKC